MKCFKWKKWYPWTLLFIQNRACFLADNLAMFWEFYIILFGTRFLLFPFLFFLFYFMCMGIFLAYIYAQCPWTRLECIWSSAPLQLELKATVIHYPLWRFSKSLGIRVSWWNIKLCFTVCLTHSQFYQFTQNLIVPPHELSILISNSFAYLQLSVCDFYLM